MKIRYGIIWTGDARRGFSLIELLIVVAIIGLLSAAGLASFALAKAHARDGQRISDAKQIQTAVEFFFENHNAYPVDGHPGPAGIVLGGPGATALSDAGFSDVAAGTPFMSPVPSNPEPNGSPYVYRSLDRDGRDCDDGRCYAYAVIFTMESGQGGLAKGTHAFTSEGLAGEGRGSAGAGVEMAGGGIIGLQETAALYAQDSAATIMGMIGDPRTQIAATAIAPAATVLSVITAAASANAAALGFGQLFILAIQPLLLVRRRRGMTWGIVYNSLSKLPVDLATVRLFDAVTGRLLRSAVTDRYGRYVFLVERGKYKIMVVRNGITFPTKVADKVRDDGRFRDIYHGEELTDAGGIIARNVPVDPVVREMDDATALAQLKRRRDWRTTVAAIGPALGFFSFVIRPVPLTAVLLGAQLLAYLFFKRLRVGSEVKQWGVVYDEATSRPLRRAVVRIFAMPYGKLLETQVTDERGRYSFLVGDGKYFLTVTKEGYYKTETDPVDLMMVMRATAIASDIPLRPLMKEKNP